jgi:hypothetical protein
VTNRNRGGFGWQEPQYTFHAGIGGRQQGKNAAREAILRAAMESGLIFPMGFDPGDASPTPPPATKWPNAIHDDPIDMIEIGGVWMCEADARFARGVDFGSQPGQIA